MRIIFLGIVIMIVTFSCKTVKNESVTENQNKTAKEYQAKAPSFKPFGKKAFKATNKTTIRWLGMAGFMINSHNTTLMIDPVLKDFEMPLLIDIPIETKTVPYLDAVLITHSDNDHYSVSTCIDLKSVTQEYHSTIYVDYLMKNQDLHSFGHGIGEIFFVKDIKVTLTPVDHAWQNDNPEFNNERHWKQEDCTGFWIETPDGTIWATGDSRLLPEHLQMPAPDAILFDFSNSEWHFTMEGAVKLANAYPNTPLLLHHWGSVDAPDFEPFNGDPEKLKTLVINPERLVILAPGEPYTLTRIKN
jgi:L-ascorbate metabolism protein UlaG (beta-lactamase superfamily)